MENLTEQQKTLFEFDNVSTDALKDITATPPPPDQERPPIDQDAFKQPESDGNGQAPEEIKAGDIISANIVMEVLNIVIPKMIATAVKVIAKKNVTTRQLSATQAEKETIQPVLQNYLDSVHFKLSPLNALIITLAAVYGAKTIDILNAPVMSVATNTGLADNRTTAAKGGRPPVQKGGKLSAYMRKKQAAAGNAKNIFEK